MKTPTTLVYFGGTDTDPVWVTGTPDDVGDSINEARRARELFHVSSPRGLDVRINPDRVTFLRAGKDVETPNT